MDQIGEVDKSNLHGKRSVTQEGSSQVTRTCSHKFDDNNRTESSLMNGSSRALRGSTTLSNSSGGLNALDPVVDRYIDRIMI